MSFPPPDMTESVPTTEPDVIVAAIPVELVVSGAEFGKVLRRNPQNTRSLPSSPIR